MSQRLPSYGYIPGRWPHPFRDPEGHSYQLMESEPKTLNPERWQACASYLWGFELFNAGYYWEAHEVWEGFWRGSERGDHMRELLQALIKLAAAGIKVRQGIPTSARSFLEQSRNQFRRVNAMLAAETESHGTQTVAGLSVTRLLAWCDQYIPEVEQMKADPSLPVEVVFSEKLILEL
jgi:uncharacterized protein